MRNNMPVDTKTLLELRKITGAGMNDCHIALEESQGDIQNAIKILRKKGAVAAAKKSDRTVCEGVIALAFSHDKKDGSIIQIHCETDFVAKNSEFMDFAQHIAKTGLTGDSYAEFEHSKDALILKLGENITLQRLEKIHGEYLEGYIHSNKKVGALVSFSVGLHSEVAHDIAMHIAASNPASLAPEDIPTDIIEKQKEIFRNDSQFENKPLEIVEKIIQGKLQKFYQEKCLLLQPFIKDDSVSVHDYLKQTSPGVKIIQFIRFQV